MRRQSVTLLTRASSHTSAVVRRGGRFAKSSVLALTW